VEMAQFPAKMAEIYGRIMNDVLESSHREFEAQGVDTNFLTELHRLWSEKLNAYGTQVRTDLAGSSMMGGYAAACPPLMQHDAHGYPLDMRRETGFPQTDGADVNLQIIPECAEDEVTEEGSARTEGSSAVRDRKMCTIVIEQTDGAGSSPVKRRRVGEDGESDGDDDDEEEDEEANEEEELGSDDDDDDDEDDAANSTHNLILCQYEKVNRTKNKWKAALKFGVMTLAINDSGRVRKQDFVFKKGNADMNFSS